VLTAAMTGLRQGELLRRDRAGRRLRVDDFEQLDELVGDRRLTPQRREEPVDRVEVPLAR
jgi:hypothetical protein